MKRLVLSLILLIISIPAFAQERSAFIENFSLAKQSGNNNHRVFEIDIFSEQSKLLGFNVFENRKQNWWSKSNIRNGPQQYLSSKEESVSLAELYLERTAERTKKLRKTGGYIGLIAGGTLIALGASMTSEESEGGVWDIDITPAFGYFSIIMGAACVGGGIYILATPSRAQRELEDIRRILDPVQRERASHNSLSFLADRGRRNRILNGILSAVVAVSSVVGDSPEYAYGAPFAASAIYSFFVKSPAERTFQDYLKERESKQRKELALRVSIMAYDGVKISFELSF